MPAAPVAVGKYQIQELVGEGAMGCVYRALDPVLNRSVAIKVMSDAIARDAELRDRFMREAQAAGSLQHPNVVTIFDFGEYEGHLYIAMEFVEGTDLEEVIEQQVPLTADHRLGIVIDVLMGLSYAHRHGVVHRDIKPANIRIDAEGRARIMDFGVAHLESARMTATGVMVGTPNYMAPEQVTGQKVTPATDIFAIGAVLYELMSGRKPFGAESLHNVLFKVVSEDPPPLAIIDPDAPPGLDPVLRKALAKEPADRYASAQEMAQELTVIRSRLQGAGTESLSLSATIAAKARGRVPGPSAATAALARSRRVQTRVVAVTVVGALAVAGGSWVYALREAAGPPVSSAPAGVGPAATTTSAFEVAQGDSAATSSGPPASSQPPAPRMAPRTAASRAAVPSVASATDSRDAVPPAVPPPDSPAAGPPGAQPAVTRDESEIVAIVRRTALDARARAESAGAVGARLAEGDSLVASASRLADARRYAEAVAALNAAGSSWREAEAGASTALRPPAAAPMATTPESLSRRGGGASDAAGAPPSAVGAAGRSTPPSPAVRIGALVSEYADAITARDLGRIRALYPTITPEQQRGFRTFFDAVSNLRAALSAGPPSVEGGTATARITGAYDYVDAAGKPQHQPVSFNATFRLEAGRWQIVSVR